MKSGVSANHEIGIRTTTFVFAVELFNEPYFTPLGLHSKGDVQSVFFQ